MPRITPLNARITQRRHTRRGLLSQAAMLLLAGAAALGASSAKAQVYNWAGGTYAPGTTGPATLALAETLNINAGAFKYFDTTSGTFTVLGLVNWNADTLYFQNGGRVLNQGVWDAHGNHTLAWNGGSPAFINEGIFRKSGGGASGVTTVQNGVGFVNRGTVDVQVGRIDFQGGSRFETGSSFIGSGEARMAGGTNTFAGTVSASSLVLQAGTFAGESASVAGSVLWRGGSLAGGWSLASGATLNITSGGFKYFEGGGGGSFSNSGTVSWALDTLYVQNGVQIGNSGSFNSAADSTLAYNGGSGNRFTNTGSFAKTGGTGATVVQNGVGFVNQGTLRADSGTLRFDGGTLFDSGSLFRGAGAISANGNNRFAGTQDSSNLVLTAGFHTGEAAVLVGDVRFAGGTLAGSWTLLAGQTLRGNTGTFKYLDAATFANNGTVSWDSSNLLYLQNAAVLNNQGLFVGTVSTQVVNNGGAQSRFVNSSAGTVRAAAGTTLSFGAGLFQNDGGRVEAEDGATVLFNTAGSSFNDASRYVGAGVVRVAANASFAGRQIGDNLRLESGVFSGSSASIEGRPSFVGGTFSGNWDVAPGATLNGGDGGFKYIDGASSSVTVRGSVHWNTSNFWYLQNGARLVVDGEFRANASTTLVDNGGVTPGVDNNAGGRITAAAGQTLAVALPLVNRGTLHAEAGATVRYDGRANFLNGTVFSGDGVNSAQGNNRFEGGFQSNNLRLTSGVHEGSGAMAFGRTTFASGRLTGSWSVPVGQEMRVTLGGFKYLSGTTTSVFNDGHWLFASGDAIYFENGARFTNRGTLELIGGSSFIDNGGAAPTVRNEGLLLKTGSGSATISAGLGFQNLGTVDVQEGNLALPAGWVNEGRLMGTGSLSVAGAALGNAGTLAPGSAAAPGTLSLSGSFSQAAAGVMLMRLGTLASHDAFNVSVTAALGGTLALVCFAECSYAVGDVITLVDSVGDLTGTFDGITLTGFATGAFEPLYDRVADRFQLRVTEAVSSVPEPQTYALMLGGLLAIGWLRRRAMQRA
jgi:fibronectin-binding autotransporter adhesin